MCRRFNSAPRHHRINDLQLRQFSKTLHFARNFARESRFLRNGRLNGIYAPINEKRVVLKLMGGIGGSKTGFSLPESSCVGTAVCEYSNESIGSSSHFQIHVGAGVEVYLTEHIFVRPQFDFRYVPNFMDQFGSSAVMGGMLWVGFNTGGR